MGLLLILPPRWGRTSASYRTRNKTPHAHLRPNAPLVSRCKHVSFSRLLYTQNTWSMCRHCRAPNRLTHTCVSAERTETVTTLGEVCLSYMDDLMACFQWLLLMRKRTEVYAENLQLPGLWFDGDSSGRCGRGLYHTSPSVALILQRGKLRQLETTCFSKGPHGLRLPGYSKLLWLASPHFPIRPTQPSKQCRGNTRSGSALPVATVSSILRLFPPASYPSCQQQLSKLMAEEAG